jgi:hypothetical protein
MAKMTPRHRLKEVKKVCVVDLRTLSVCCALHRKQRPVYFRQLTYFVYLCSFSFLFLDKDKQPKLPPNFVPSFGNRALSDIMNYQKTVLPELEIPLVGTEKRR